ncbi:MAG: HAD family hydrolase [Prevotella sp.]
MIKNIIFDFGGVIMTIDHGRAIERFSHLGLDDASRQLDPYTQSGIFGAIEEGRIDSGQFIHKLSEMCGKAISHDECKWAWLGYAKDVPQRNIEMLKRLRAEGYRLIMLSNTNPFVMSWAQSPEFSRGKDRDIPEGTGVGHYFDAQYLSYEVKAMKPDMRFFNHVVTSEMIRPDETLFIDDGPRNVEAAARLGMMTLRPDNGSDWTGALIGMLNEKS